MNHVTHTAECGAQPAGCGCICNAEAVPHRAKLSLVWSAPKPKKLEVPMLSRADYDLLYGHMRPKQ